MTTLRLNYHLDGDRADLPDDDLCADGDGDRVFTRWTHESDLTTTAVRVSINVGTPPHEAARLIRKMARILDRDGMPIVDPSELGDLEPLGA